MTKIEEFSTGNEIEYYIDACRTSLLINYDNFIYVRVQFLQIIDSFVRGIPSYQKTCEQTISAKL